MPPETYPYAVFGFSENLDWSTFHFVKPIDDIRVCSACRVVARKAAFLPCRHVLCEPCYEQWKPRVKVCFLDGELCPENEVYWREFPLERMMKSEVRCWNRENGCETITEVSSIAEHFHRDCAYHSTCCPKCSSTVLRRDIVAHLESRCVSHVLYRKYTRSPIDGVSKELVEFRERLRCIELALRISKHTNAPVPSLLQAAKEENLNPLLTMAGEVEQVAASTMRALSLVNAGYQRSLNQAVHLKTFEANLPVELEKLKSAVEELGCRESAASREKAELEEHFENLQLLRKEIEVVSSKLQKWRKQVDPEAAIVESAVAGGLSEVRISSRASSYYGERFSHDVTMRVFENALKVPVKVFCTVDRWTEPTNTIKGFRPLTYRVEGSVDDNRYRINVVISRSMKNAPFYIQAYVREPRDVVLAEVPLKMNLAFFGGKKGQAEYEGGERAAGLLHTDEGVWRYLLWEVVVGNLEDSVRVDRDQLRMCLTFSY